MIEAKIDMWDAVRKRWDDRPNNWLCITTNGVVKDNGACVMGRGTAKEARDTFPGLDTHLGNMIKYLGNRCMFLGVKQIGHSSFNDEGTFTLEANQFALFNFPVKRHWKDKADLDLIRESAEQLRDFWWEADWPGKVTVIVPRPGCGNGGLDWESQVKPIMEEYFPEDNFVFIGK